VVDQWTGFNDATDTGDGVHPNAAGDQKMSDKWYPALTAALVGAPPPVDTQAPSVPGTPAVSALTAASLNLTWTASTDNAGVAGYDIFRAPGASGGTFASVGTSTSPSFTDTGLTAATTYRYQIRARDAAGNLSAFTAAVSATTGASGGGGGNAGCGGAYRVANAWQGAFQGEVVVTNTSPSAITAWTLTLALPSGVTITQLWGGTFSPASGTVTVHNLSYNGSLAPNATTTIGFLANASGSAGAIATTTCAAS